MNTNQRIQSILKAQNIGVEIDGIRNFLISDLEIVVQKTFDYPDNLRLGKQIEKIVSSLITASSNYEIVCENIQVLDGKITIGELDFVVKNIKNNILFHLELVYKFYLYDPKHSDIELKKWIGPNRKDSFIEKYDKLKNKQFPLLYKSQTKSHLKGIEISELEQKLCFIASLFIPHNLFSQRFSLVNNNAIVGYWQSLVAFEKYQSDASQFYLPPKKEWGINPSSNNNWESYVDVIKQIKDFHSRNFSPLCWVKKQDNTFEQCFIVWW